MDYGMRMPHRHTLHGNGWEDLAQNLTQAAIQTGQAAANQALNVGVKRSQEELNDALGVKTQVQQRGNWFASQQPQKTSSGIPMWAYGLGALAVVGGIVYYARS